MALVVVGLASGSSLLAGMGFVGVVVAGGSWLWSRVSLQRLVYERHLSRSRAFPGDVLELNIAITNRKWLPATWVRVQDEIPEGLEIIADSRQVISGQRVSALVHTTSLSAFERVRWTYQVRASQRGLYRVGPEMTRSGDPFGFFPREQRGGSREALLVYPQPVPLPDLRLPAKWPVGDRPGVQQIHGDPSRPAGTREYEPGDPWRLVDWKASARRGGLHVKVLEPGASVLTVVVTNIATVADPSGGYIALHLERLATVSASLAQDALTAGQSVGLETNGKSLLFERPMSVGLGRSHQHLILILEALAMLGPFVSAPIEETLLSARRRLPTGVTMVLVTAIMTPGLAHALELLQREGRDPVVAWVADRAPEGMPAGVVWRDLAPYLASLEVSA